MWFLFIKCAQQTFSRPTVVGRTTYYYVVDVDVDVGNSSRRDVFIIIIIQTTVVV